MKFAPEIVAKLRSQVSRFDEITALISEPEVASDRRRLTALLQERGALEDLAGLLARFERLSARREEDQRLLADASSEPEMRELAREDLAAIEIEEATLDDEIKAALISEPE